MMQPTAWVIDKDHLFEPNDLPDTNDAGVTGPSDAPEDLLLRLKNGEGVKFRILDGDDELYYTGRIIAVDTDGTDMNYPNCGEEFFRPLWDFGTPNAGACEIQYKDPDSKEWRGL